jgi:hypothetical protein
MLDALRLAVPDHDLAAAAQCHRAERSDGNGNLRQSRHLRQSEQGEHEQPDAIHPDLLHS